MDGVCDYVREGDGRSKASADPMSLQFTLTLVEVVVLEEGGEVAGDRLAAVLLREGVRLVQAGRLEVGGPRTLEGGRVLCSRTLILNDKLLRHMSPFLTICFSRIWPHSDGRTLALTAFWTSAYASWTCFLRGRFMANAPVNTYGIDNV